jgi:hypothetical protein
MPTCVLLSPIMAMNITAREEKENASLNKYIIFVILKWANL